MIIVCLLSSLLFLLTLRLLHFHCFCYDLLHVSLRILYSWDLEDLGRCALRVFTCLQVLIWGSFWYMVYGFVSFLVAQPEKNSYYLGSGGQQG